MLLRRRIRRRRPAGARALGWLAAAAAVAAAAAGTALWEPGASAQGIQPAGSIGRDGWIRGPGYDVRLIPNWYAFGNETDEREVVITPELVIRGTTARPRYGPTVGCPP